MQRTRSENKLSFLSNQKYSLNQNLGFIKKIKLTKTQGSLEKSKLDNIGSYHGKNVQIDVGSPKAKIKTNNNKKLNILFN
jgi:hypothetical protein